jgi:hypothetical protein
MRMLRAAAPLAAGLALVLGARAAAQQEGSDYPHAFPRTGTVQLLDTDRVTMWEVNWIHGVEQPIHRHRYDMAGVYLRFGEITVTRPDGTATTGAPFPVPRPYFQSKDITHREEARGKPGDPERLAIMLDLKGVPSPARATAAGVAAQFPRPGAASVLENARVRMWDYTWQPGAPTGRHVHDTDTVEVFVSGGTIRTTAADGTTETHAVAFKTARFVPRGRVDTEEAVDGAPRAIVVELRRGAEISRENGQWLRRPSTING